MTTKTAALPAIPGLEGSDFGAPSVPKNRLIWSVYGATKTTKSTFGLWGPEPLVICDLDIRLERVINDFISGKTTGTPRTRTRSMQIHMPEVDPMSRLKDETVRKEANVTWDRFLYNYNMSLESSLQSGGVRTTTVDTGTELFDLRLMAEFGRLMGINPRDRGGANAEFVKVMRKGEKYNANVIWLHHAKDEWKNITDENGREKSITTGGVVLDGFNKANAVVQVVAKTTWNDTVKDPRKKAEITIVRCGVNSQLNGKKFTSADWAVWDEDGGPEDPPIINYGPVAYLSSLIVPDTTPEEWS